MAFISIKQYADLTNTDISKVYKMIKANQLNSEIIKKIKHVEIDEEEFSLLYAEKHQLFNTVEEPKDIKRNDTDSTTELLLSLLLEKEKKAEKKDELIASLVQKNTEAMDTNKRMTNAVLNRLEIQNETERKPLTLQKAT